MSTQVDNARRLPALDGVRAIAIGLVLIGHVIAYFAAWVDAGALIGEAGVSIFFVLSGFLVTRVMVVDENRAGRLRLGRFYRRRVLRIFPAFYVFWLVLSALFAARVLPFPGKTIWLGSALYFRNFLGADWSTGHLWSLSLEEQFYVLWPVLFLLLRTKRRRLQFIGLAVLASTTWRFYWVAHFGSYMPTGVIRQVHYLPQMRLDTFLIGAAFCLGEWRWITSITPRFIIPFLVIWYDNAVSLRWALPFETVVTSFGIGLLILWLVQTPQLRPAHYLSRPAIAWVGAISYSIYLWQQLFLGPYLGWWSGFAIAACACTSYYVIERPALRLKERLER